MHSRNTHFTLGDYLCGTVKLTDSQKYGSSGMILDLMHVHNFHCPMERGDKSSITFELGDISSMHADNIKNVISALEECPTDRLDDATIT